MVLFSRPPSCISSAGRSSGMVAIPSADPPASPVSGVLDSRRRRERQLHWGLRDQYDGAGVDGVRLLVRWLVDVSGLPLEDVRRGCPLRP